jgi:hypothetical protein
LPLSRIGDSFYVYFAFLAISQPQNLSGNPRFKPPQNFLIEANAAQNRSPLQIEPSVPEKVLQPLVVEQ